jgi:hypothetical protein
MKIIFDTNILIHIEDPKELSPNLQDLLNIIRRYGHQIFIHPASLKDINNDKNVQRRAIILSKLRGYPLIELPPRPTDDFLSMMGPSSSSNEINDKEILFAIQKNAADFLVTEDYGLHKKANRIDLDDRVLSIASALDYFKNLYARIVPKHALLKEDYVRNLDVDDPFFDLLKEDYGDIAFRDWFKRISIEGRKCWVYHEHSNIKTLLILKEENELIETIPPIPAAERLKIATLKVDLSGYKLGELLLKMAFQYCIDNHIFEIYLTHFRKENDGLIHLIENYGFESVGFLKKNNEEVFVKKFIPTEKELLPVEISKKYYPSFKDAQKIKKFLIPIQPEFHDRLFPDYENRQMKLTDYSEINAPGNAIKKAYLSHSPIKKMNAGDVVLFYRSRDKKAVISLGVVDQKPFHTDDLELLLRSVGKRSVYSHPELKKWTEKPVFVILFRHHLNLPKPLDISFLRDHSIPVPQTISEINHKQYMAIKEGGEIDERFTVG